MGDLGREPSMEEILTSIKRIIAEEGEEAAKVTSKAPRRGRAEPLPEAGDEPEEILELTDPVEDAETAAPVEEASQASSPIRMKTAASAPREAAASAEDDGMLSVASEVSTRLSLAALSTMLVKPQAGEDNTLEGLVRGMLRPMLKEWLDANLPALVEEMVAKEIARITAR